MGSQQFSQEISGPSLAEAFRTAIAAARHDYGHRGDTGTLADKDTFVIVSADPLPEDEAYAMADRILDDAQDPTFSTWGPAGAIRIQDPDTGEHRPKWLVFGYSPT